MLFRLCIFARENKKDNMCGMVGYIDMYQPKGEASVLLLTAILKFPPLSSKNFYPKVILPVTVPVQRSPFISFHVSCRVTGFVRPIIYVSEVRKH